MCKDWYKEKKVAITGGLGFLGSNLAHELVLLGADVTIVDPMLPLYGGNLFNLSGIENKVTVNYADIRDAGAMDVLVKDKDVIFHIGGQTSHVDSMSDPFLDVDINCRGNLVFLEACRKNNPDVKIVYAGTRGQYGVVNTTPVNEEARLRPTDIYGVNKNAGEKYHLIYCSAYGIQSTVLRISNTYGPRHQMKHGKYGIQNWMIRLALDDETISVYGDGAQLRDFNFVDDVSRAFLMAGASNAANGKVYNLGSGSPVSFRQMVKTVVELAGSGKIEFVEWPEERRIIETGDYVADFTRIKEDLGWKPQTGFEQGIEQTVAFYKRFRQHYW